MTGGTPPSAALRRRRATLGSPNFVALWGSTTASNLADGLCQVGLPLLALTLTRSPGLIAAVTFVLTLPWLLFALPVGALVEVNNGSYTVYTADPDGLVRALSLQGVAFTGLQVERASLEEAFLSLTGGAS